MNELKPILSKFGDFKWQDLWNAIYNGMVYSLPLLSFNLLTEINNIDFGKYELVMATICGIGLKSLLNKYSNKIYPTR